MDEKSKSGQRSTISESMRYFGNKVHSGSAVGSYRKQKLHSSKSMNTGHEILSHYHVRDEDEGSDSSIAEDVIQSGKHTGEYVTESVGKTMQKRRIKKKMVTTVERKRAKEATKNTSNFSGKVLSGVDNAINRIEEEVGKFIADNPLPVVCVLVVGILLLVVSASLSSCSVIIGSFQGSAITTSYTAADSEILAAETYYVDLEDQLQERIDQIETNYPGYDEYDYVLDDIEHDPHELISILTVLYEDFDESEVIGTMVGIFDVQYTISLTETEETRTRMETQTRWEKKTRIEEREGTRVKWDEVKKKFVLEVYTYEVEVEYWEEVEYEEEVEYQYYVLNATLTNKTITGVVNDLSLTDEQMERYELLLALKGNKSYLF